MKMLKAACVAVFISLAGCSSNEVIARLWI